MVTGDPTELTTDKERARWAFDEFGSAGYSASDEETPGQVRFPYSPRKDATLEELTNTTMSGWSGKFILLSLSVSSDRWDKSPLKKDAVRMCLRGSTHLTIARYAVQELMQYLRQGFGNVQFTPDNILFLQNHHGGCTYLLNHEYAQLNVINCGKITVLPEKKIVLSEYSQTFSSDCLVNPVRKGFTGREDPRLADTWKTHLGDLQRGASALKSLYDDFSVSIAKDSSEKTI